MHFSPPTKVILLLLFSIFLCKSSMAQDDIDENFIGKTPTEVVRARGFLADDLYFTNRRGDLINVVRVRHPRINNGTGGLKNKDVVLAIHGFLVNAKFFIVNSKGAHPEDLDDTDCADLSIDQLNAKYANNPNAKSIVFLLVNCGHEMFLMNRRGTPESQGNINPEYQPVLNPNATSYIGEMTPDSFSQAGPGPIPNNNSATDAINSILSLAIGNLTTLGNNFNPRYWNFSLDPQADDDMEGAIDLVRNITGRDKISVIGHSAGSALLLMALTVKPELANKLHKTVLWAPALDLGDDLKKNLVVVELDQFEAAFMDYIGPLIPTQSVVVLQTLIAAFCAPRATDATICEAALDIIFGPSGEQQTFDANAISCLLETVSSHELVSLLQSADKVRMHFYDYRNKIRNKIAYGVSPSPIYNISKIIAQNISIWYGNTDTLVTPTDVGYILEDLRVPVKTIFIDNPGIFFNHISFYIHEFIETLLNTRTLYEIEH